MMSAPAMPMPSPVTSINMLEATGAQGAVMSNIPVYGSLAGATTTAPVTYAGPPTTVVAPPVYMNQQPVTTAVVPPTTATSIAPPVYVDAPMMTAPQQMQYSAPQPMMMQK